MARKPTHCCHCQTKLFRNGDCPHCNQWFCPECMTSTPVGAALGGCPACQSRRWADVVKAIDEILEAPRYDKPG